MREMKDSGIAWIGNIPSNWKLSKIKYMTTQRECVGKYTPEKDKFIGLENVIGFADRYIETSTEYETSIYDVCHKGDILFGRLRPYLAKILTVPFDGYCTGEFLVFDSFNGCKNYLKYVLLSKPFIDEVNLSTYGAKMPRANADFILNMYLPLPQIVEQEKIVDFLDFKCSEIDAISADIQKEIETLEQYKRSVITETVTKGLNPDVEMKDSGIEWVGNIPAHWDVQKNKRLFVEVNNKCLATDNYTLLSVSEYYGVAPRNEKIKDGDFETRAESLNGYKICHKGDIVMNIMLAWKKATARTAYDGIVSPAYCVYRGKGIETSYYHYVFRTNGCADYFGLHSTGIIDSRLRLYTDAFFNLNSPVPPIDEQKNIATYLDSKCEEIESIIAIKKKQMETLSSYKKSLIYEYVTGKKEVPTYES